MMYISAYILENSTRIRFNQHKINNLEMFGLLHTFSPEINIEFWKKKVFPDVGSACLVKFLNHSAW